MIRSIRVKAFMENQLEVTGMIDAFLEETGCPIKVQIKIDIAVDEVFSNIASYAYENTDLPEEERTVNVDVEDTTVGDSPAVKIRFSDSGIPFNPLEREDPDIDLSIKDRSAGGLGIFVVKNNMDETSYEYENGKNVLTVIKKYR